MHTLCSKLFILMFCLLTMLPKLNISGSSCTKKSSYLTNIVLGCASLICLSLYIFSGNSHNENTIPSCQPCALTVWASLVWCRMITCFVCSCIKKQDPLLQPCAWLLSISYIWFKLIIVFWQLLHCKKKSLSLGGLVLGGYVLPWFDWALKFDSNKSCTKKHHFLSALNVIFLVCDAFLTLLSFWNFSGSFHTKKEHPLLPVICLNVIGSLIWLNFLSFSGSNFIANNIYLFFQLCAWM